MLLSSAKFVGENAVFRVIFAIPGAYGGPVNHPHRHCVRAINHAIGAMVAAAGCYRTSLEQCIGGADANSSDAGFGLESVSLRRKHSLQTATPNKDVASRTVAPDSAAFTTRSRKSIE